MNTSLPLYADKIVLTLCHEGYPGHHVLNTLLEQHLVKTRGWIEYTVYPLFSAESLLAEGSADFGLRLVFPDDTQWPWERDHLYPIVGIDPSLAELSHRVAKLKKSLAYARIDAARAYLDGTRSGEQTIAWLQEFTFATNDEAKNSLEFFETYRSYVVNYRLGEDLVQQHVDNVGGMDPKARWKVFLELLSSPQVIADLARGTTLDPDPKSAFTRPPATGRLTSTLSAVRSRRVSTSHCASSNRSNGSACATTTRSMAAACRMVTSSVRNPPRRSPPRADPAAHRARTCRA